MAIQGLFEKEVVMNDNFLVLSDSHNGVNQTQTNGVFSEKWEKVGKSSDDLSVLEDFQKDWFLTLYGFDSEADLAKYLQKQEFILDTGCGLGYKTAWFASLSPESTVIGVDFSTSAEIAAQTYAHLPNCFFLRGDIADTGFKSGTIDFVLCDQVVMHTEKADATFAHLASITKQKGEFACYVYAKKSLPRELLDDHFRTATHGIKSEDLWKMSEQLTELGKRLSELNVSFEAPDIPQLGIKGGTYDIQRFIYWNFLKCFYRDDWSKELNDSTNFDWYAPSNAKRFSKEEFKQLIADNGLGISYFHEEEACYTGRFSKG